MNFFNIFVLWAKRFRNFDRKFMQDCQNCFLRVQNNVLRNLFEKVSLLFNIFGKWAKKLSNYWPKVSGRFFKSAFDVSTETSWGFFLKNAQFFHHFWTLSSKFYPTSAENLPQACQKCIIGVKGNILRKNNFFGKNTCFFWLLLDFQPIFFRKFDKNFSAQLYKLHFAYTGEESEQKVFWKKNNFLLMFVTLVTKKLGLLAKKPQQVCQNCFLCVQRNVWMIFFGKTYSFWSFTDFERKHFEIFWNFSQGCQNSVLSLQRNILTENKFLE